MENCCHVLLEVLLQLSENNVKCSHRRQIARRKFILISNCQNYHIINSNYVISEDSSNKLVLQFWHE